jgi:hypothetical protein
LSTHGESNFRHDKFDAFAKTRVKLVFVIPANAGIPEFMEEPVPPNNAVWDMSDAEIDFIWSF